MIAAAGFLTQTHGVGLVDVRLAEIELLRTAARVARPRAGDDRPPTVEISRFYGYATRARPDAGPPRSEHAPTAASLRVPYGGAGAMWTKLPEMADADGRVKLTIRVLGERSTSAVMSSRHEARRSSSTAVAGMPRTVVASAAN